ncbi:multiheme c-type cytochrome [Paracoccus aerodenitrificans]|uniref:multiheme c-type cytochrome n=1 Tax=Paracoccus aerodenitrificans TaxID=3017781 RepID=UPI0022F115D5|nr:multiheme c-type cytochrome [Paracoccus aerodenitrificans]WBU63785.1 multiheme c-type cytochrome [Paracoccus aerodenitrificans]
MSLYRFFRSLIALGLMVLGLNGFGLEFAAAQTPGGSVPEYIGSEACAGCHKQETSDWLGSHHDLAWEKPGPETVLGEFSGQNVSIGGSDVTFSRQGDDYSVAITEPDGTRASYNITDVVGVEPLQQYLVETEPGRKQALDFVWDVVEGQWYDLYPDEDYVPSDGLHWSGPYKNWNARCAVCHATGYDKNYVPQDHLYQSTQAEIGVGCEACHGPGSAHAEWAKAPESYDISGMPGLSALGFTASFSKDDPDAQIQVCAGCHSRRSALTDESPVPGTAYHDSYELALIDADRLYYPDGAIRDEVYVYGSFLQSKMYQNGVQCSDCHNPHSTRLKAEGNAVCTQCHSEAGNTRFPSLKLADYDSPDHYFHPQGSEGAQCKNCHMKAQTYMGIDERSDHAFRIPRPDLSVETGAPLACLDCHADKDTEWADKAILAAHPDADRGPHFSQTFAHGHGGEDPGTLPSLFDIAEDETTPAIIRASALGLAASHMQPEDTERAARQLSAGDPLIRAAAIPLQRSAAPDDKLQRIAPLLEDPARSVRITAVKELLQNPGLRVAPEHQAGFEQGIREMQQWLMANADYPEGQLALGGTALALRNIPAALSAFAEATQQDPQLADAWVMQVRLLAAQNRIEAAREVLSRAMAANPGNAQLLSLDLQLSPR